MKKVNVFVKFFLFLPFINNCNPNEQYISDLESEIWILKKKIKKNNSQQTKIKQQGEIEELQGVQAELQKAKDKAEAELQGVQAELAKQKAELQKAEAELQGVQAELQKAKAELQTAKDKAELAKQKAELESKIGELQTAKEELAKQKVELESKIEELQKAKAELQTAKDKAEAELQGVQAELAKQKAELESKIGELQTAKDKAEAKSNALLQQKMGILQQISILHSETLNFWQPRNLFDEIQKTGKIVDQYLPVELKGQIEKICSERNIDQLKAFIKAVEEAIAAKKLDVIIINIDTKKELVYMFISFIKSQLDLFEVITAINKFLKQVSDLITPTAQ